MTLRAGIAIERRGGRIVAARNGRHKAEILFDHAVPREPGRGPAEVLGDLLQARPPHLKGIPLGIALSAGDCACADAWPLPPGLPPSALPMLGPALCETHCAGESLEGLAPDVISKDSTAQGVALKNEVLDGLRKTAAAAGVSIEFVTAVPAVVAGVFGHQGAIRCRAAGEEIALEGENGHVGWRSYPLEGDSPAEPGPALEAKGLCVEERLAAAFAAAVVDPDDVPNVLRGAPDAPRSRWGRVRRPLVGLGVGGIAFLLGITFWLHLEGKAVQSEIEAVGGEEARLWKSFLPGNAPRQGELLRTMNEHLRQVGESPEGREYPSALSFLIEVARNLPDVEPLGMTIDSLDLTPEGGRMNAILPAVPGDELKNAAILEARLNASDRLTSRGDYERRGNDIQVRLRMDYRMAPRGGTR